MSVGESVSRRLRADVPTGERRDHQASYFDASERFRTSYADSPVGLALLVPDGEIFHANPALCRMLECDEADLVGGSLVDRVVADDAMMAKEALRRAVADGGSRGSFSARFELPSGGCRWAGLTVRVVSARAGEPLMLVVHVEDRTAAVEAVAALGHASRVALAGRLASGVIHDVRNALTALQGRAELLAAEVVDSEAVRSHLQSMTLAVSRANSLANQVLDLVRAAPPGRELIDLAGIVLSFEPVARAQFDEPSRVEVSAQEAVLLEADPAEIERVLLTLVANAVEAVADGGVVRISVSSVIQLDGEHSMPFARLVVEDTGVGMDEETVARVFEPFFTTKGPGGLGLGLPSTDSVVRALGGTMRIDSAPGRGTTVEVLFPAVAAQAATE